MDILSRLVLAALWALEQLVICVHLGKHLSLIIEHQRRNQVILAQEINELVHASAYASPLLPRHRPAHIQIQQHCEILNLKLQHRLVLLLIHDGSSSVVHDGGDLFPLLQTQINSYPLKNPVYLRIVNAVVLRVLPPSFGDGLELELCLLGDSHSD